MLAAAIDAGPMADLEPSGRPTSSDQSLRNLDRRLEALSASRLKTPRAIHASGSEAGYRMMAELVGGVLAGLGLGWAFDRLAHTAPIGLIAGLLIGTGLSVYLVVRTASQMSEAARAANPASDLADDGNDDGDERG